MVITSLVMQKKKKKKNVLLELPRIESSWVALQHVYAVTVLYFELAE